MPTIEQARAWYSTLDPVHGFDHILRVYRLAGVLARAEGADLEIVHAAALLHDASGDQPAAVDSPGTAPEEGSSRLTHQHVSAEFAGRVLQAEGWSSERIAAVEHCIRSHRFRDRHEEPQTREAQVLYDADKLDAIGAIGVARAVAYAARKNIPAYTSPSEQFLRTGQEEPGELHSAYHEFLFKLVKLKERLYTPTGRRFAEERHRRMVAYFDQLASEMEGQS